MGHGPFLTIGIHAQGNRRTRPKSGENEFIWRRAEIGAAETFRLVRQDMVVSSMDILRINSARPFFDYHVCAHHRLLYKLCERIKFYAECHVARNGFVVGSPALILENLIEA